MRLILAALTVGMVLTISAHAQNPEVRFVLDFALLGQHSPFILAADGGYFAREGVDVRVDAGAGSGDAIVKVASGTNDMGFADLGALIQFNARQGGTKVISVFQVYDIAPMVIISLSKSNINKPADLAGKTLAAPPGASSRVMFPLLAKANGFDPATVHWIDVQPRLRETMLARGQVDAAPSLITDLASMHHFGFKDSELSVMRYSDFGVKVYGHVILTTPEFAAKNPDTVKKVLRGFTKALQATIADPAAAIAALKKREPLSDDVVNRERIDSVLKNTIVTPGVRAAGLSVVDPDRLKKTIETVSAAFDVPAADPTAIYHPEFLPPINERAIPTGK
jgi:NitT/TauT family transport system substrate-binding protein